MRHSRTLFDHNVRREKEIRDEGLNVLSLQSKMGKIRRLQKMKANRR